MDLHLKIDDRIEWLDFDAIPQEGRVVEVCPDGPPRCGVHQEPLAGDASWEAFLAVTSDDELLWGYCIQITEVNGLVVF